MKLTDWFPAGVKPIHEGVYEARMEVIEDRLGGRCIEQGFAYWNGARWGCMLRTVEATGRWDIQGSQGKEWRGLAEKPE